MSWLLFSKSSANVSLPFGPSKTYFFSTSSHGNSRRFRLNSSRIRENSFSLVRNAVRALIHSSCETIGCFATLFPASLAIFFLQSRVMRCGAYRSIHLGTSLREISGEFLCDSAPAILVALGNSTIKEPLVSQYQIGFVTLRQEFNCNQRDLARFFDR